MKRAATFQTFLALVLLLAAACDHGVGRSLVGKLKPEPDGPPLACGHPAPLCSFDAGFFRGLDATVSFESDAGIPFDTDLAACGNAGAACGPLAAAGPEGSISKCDLSSSLAAFVNGAIDDVACSRVRLSATSADPELVLLQGFRAAAADVSLQASRPVTVELAGATLSNTRITLAGPVTLKITADAQLDHVAIVAASDVGASLQLTDVSVTQLVVSLPGGTFGMQRATLVGATLAAGRQELSSSSLTSVDVTADELWLADVQASKLSLWLAGGTIAGAQLDQVTLQRCRSLLLTGSRMTASSLAGCSDMLRVDRSAIGDSTFAGPVASHLNVWEAVTFGVGGTASLSSWNDTVSNARFCAGTSQVVLGDPIGLNCNECDGWTAPPTQAFCFAHAGSSPASRPTSLSDTNPECPVLDNLQMCSPAETNKNPF